MEMSIEKGKFLVNETGEVRRKKKKAFFAFIYIPSVSIMLSIQRALWILQAFCSHLLLR